MKKFTKKHKQKISKAIVKKWQNLEYRKRMAKARKGWIETKEHRENISKGLKGKKHSNKHKENISKAGRQENNSNWKGGISFEPYSIEFNNQLKEEIRQRDNCQCRFCGIKENGRAFCPHHIDYNKKNNNKKNFLLLCNSCNAKANFQREKWQFCFEILQELNGSVA